MENIIDKMEALLLPSANQNIRDVLNFVNNDSHVKAQGWNVTEEAFAFFLKASLKGYRYLQKTYGEESLPRNINLVPGHTGTKNGTLYERREIVGYFDEEDALVFSPLYIGRVASSHEKEGNNKVFPNKHYQGLTTIEDFLTLIAVEEGYHRYQFRVLGMKYDAPEEGNICEYNAFEQAASDPIRQAIQKLGISVAPSPTKISRIKRALFPLRKIVHGFSQNTPHF